MVENKGHGQIGKPNPKHAVLNLVEEMWPDRSVSEGFHHKMRNKRLRDEQREKSSRTKDRRAVVSK